VSVLLMCWHTSTAATVSFTTATTTTTTTTTVVVVVVVVVGRDSAVGSLQAGQSGVRIPVGGDIFHTHPDWPWGPPRLLYYGYRFLSRDKAAGVWR
jgi:hypothetical protein